MEEFKKNLLKICGKNIVAPIIFLGIGVLFLVIGLIPEWTTYKSFDPQSDGYATLDELYANEITEQSDEYNCESNVQ